MSGKGFDRSWPPCFKPHPTATRQAGNDLTTTTYATYGHTMCLLHDPKTSRTRHTRSRGEKCQSPQHARDEHNTIVGQRSILVGGEGVGVHKRATTELGTRACAVQSYPLQPESKGGAQFSKIIFLLPTCGVEQEF